MTESPDGMPNHLHNTVVHPSLKHEPEREDIDVANLRTMGYALKSKTRRWSLVPKIWRIKFPWKFTVVGVGVRAVTIMSYQRFR